jgi:hypothetical protein
MKHTFYLGCRFVAATCILMAIGACGRNSDPQPPQGNGGAATSPYFVQASVPYEPVAVDQLLQRHIEKLRTGSRTGLRFAKEMIGSYGDAAVPALVEGLRLELEQNSTVAANFMSALSYTRTKQSLPILLEVLNQHSSPLVRSQAVDTISLLQQTDLIPGLLAHADREFESGPLMRVLPCLSALGGKEAAEYLADVVRQWLLDDGKKGRGAAAWDGLLEMQGDDALPLIADLEGQLPPFMRNAGWLRLLQGGQMDWLEQVRTLTDPVVMGKASLRGRAVVLMCELGEWETAAVAANDPNPAVRTAYINGLRAKQADFTEAEHAHLIKIASSPSKDEAYPALRVLLERGEGVHLEPWLAQVKGYPTRPGSIEALHMFMQEGITHPRLVPMLKERWPFCERDFRIDVTRVMAKHPTPEAIAFLEAVVMDPEEDPEVRLFGLNSLGNAGDACVPSLFRVWEQKPSPATSDRLFGLMLRYAERDDIREFCFQLVVDPDAPDFAKAQMLSKLPLSYREDAYPVLLQAREATERPEIHLYIDGILADYF